MANFGTNATSTLNFASLSLSLYLSNKLDIRSFHRPRKCTLCETRTNISSRGEKRERTRPRGQVTRNEAWFTRRRDSCSDLWRICMILRARARAFFPLALANFSRRAGHGETRVTSSRDHHRAPGRFSISRDSFRGFRATKGGERPRAIVQ